MSEKEFYMTKLEEQLHATGGEEVRQSVFNLLDKNRAKVKAEMDKGVPPAEYAVCSKIYEALEAACAVLESSEE